MEIKEIKKLSSGDEVFWNDPDEGICSRILNISQIKIRGDIVCITETNGNYIEVFCVELS